MPADTEPFKRLDLSLADDWSVEDPEPDRDGEIELRWAQERNGIKETD